MFYPVIIAMQLFCFYHAYSRRVEIWWYLLISFLPVLGSLIYLYYHFYTPTNLDTIGNIAEEVRGTVDNTYRARKLQKQLNFADTASNKLKLGEEYLNSGLYDEAYALFKSCNNGVFENDPEILARLVQTSFLLHDYESTIEYGEQPNFKEGLQINNEKVDLAWAYLYRGRKNKARRQFETFDKSYGSYYMRHEYIKYLLETDQDELANEKMNNLLEEINEMNRSERSVNTHIIRAIKATRKSF